MTDLTDAMKKKPKRARWYMQYIGECAICGLDGSWREARYTRPPAKKRRYEYLPADACSDHFL